METKFEVINEDSQNTQEIYECAAAILRNGGLVAFPTETVYGLGADALNPEAAAKIYRAKGRPSDNPLIVHIADVSALYDLCENVPEKALTLAKAFWPGPLTMVLNKKDKVPYATTGGLDTVAIRMPEHRVARELIKNSGVYIAAPSANISGRPSPTRAEHVRADLDGRIDMIIDGGSVKVGIESTIIDLTGQIPSILRPGYITKEMLEKVIGAVEIDRAVALDIKTDAPPKAPGMKYRHYAPKGDMVIVEGEKEMVIEKINELTSMNMEKGLKTGVLATDLTKALYKADVVLSVGSRQDEITISENLFDVLRRFDDEGVQFIASESFSKKNLGYAIMNRLVKAAGGKIIKV
jgi:L-threonylcarbamoyladenylate synthase